VDFVRLSVFDNRRKMWIDVDFVRLSVFRQ
jgi:hypothetical protein